MRRLIGCNILNIGRHSQQLFYAILPQTSHIKLEVKIPFWNKMPNTEFDKYLEFTSAQFYFNENGAQKTKMKRHKKQKCRS